MNTLLMNCLMNNYRDLRCGRTLTPSERMDNQKIKYYIELLNRNATKDYIEKDYETLKRLFDYCGFGYNIVKLDEDYYGKKIFEKSSNTYGVWSRNNDDYNNSYKYYLRGDCVSDIYYDYIPQGLAKFFTMSDLYDEICKLETIDKSEFISYYNRNCHTSSYGGKVGVWISIDENRKESLINNIIRNIEDDKYEIYDYHCYPEFKTQKLDNEDVDNYSLMGVELEIEGEYVRSSNCRRMAKLRG